MKEEYIATVTTKYPENINTDNIIRADILQESWEKKFFAKHAFEKYDSEFVNRCKWQKNIIVAGKNFGSGSSREHAVYAIQYNNVEFVIGEIDPKTGTAFPDIFYGNSLNNGLKLIPLENISGIGLGDKLSLDLESQMINNLTTGVSYKFSLPKKDIELMIAKEKLINMVKSDLEKLL